MRYDLTAVRCVRIDRLHHRPDKSELRGKADAYLKTIGTPQLVEGAAHPSESHVSPPPLLPSSPPPLLPPDTRLGVLSTQGFAYGGTRPHRKAQSDVTSAMTRSTTTRNKAQPPTPPPPATTPTSTTTHLTPPPLLPPSHPTPPPSPPSSPPPSPRPEFDSPPPSPNYSPQTSSHDSSPRSSHDSSSSGSPLPAPPPPRGTCRMRTCSETVLDANRRAWRQSAADAAARAAFAARSSCGGAGSSTDPPQHFNGAPATDVKLLIAKGNDIGDEEKAHLQRAWDESTAPTEDEGFDQQTFDEALAQATADSLLTAQANAASLLRRDGVTLDGYAAAARAAQGRQGDKAAPGGGS